MSLGKLRLRLCFIAVVALSLTPLACERDAALAPHRIVSRSINPAAPTAIPPSEESFALFSLDYSGLVVLNADGSGFHILTFAANDFTWSPDGSKLAYACGQICVRNLDGSGLMQLTNDATADANPAWSPDGKRIAYANGGILKLVNVDGSGESALAGDPAGGGPTWAPDGNRIAFEARTSNGTFQIFVIGTDGSGLAQITSDTTSNADPAWSPDGRTIAFSHSIPGFGNHWDVWLVNPDGTGLTQVTHTDPATASAFAGYSHPSWSPDGRLLLAVGANFGADVGVSLIDMTTMEPVKFFGPGQIAKFAPLAPSLEAAATMTVLTAPAPSVAAGVVIAPHLQVTLLNSAGLPATQSAAPVTVSLSQNATGATLVGRTTVNAVDGAATFDSLLVTEPGTGLTLTFSSPGLPPLTTSPFNVTSDRHLKFIVGPRGAIEGGVPVAPFIKVTIVDGAGNTDTTSTQTVAMQLIGDPTGAAMTGNLSATATNGVARFADLRIGSVGSNYRLVATAFAAWPDTSTAFAVKRVAGSTP